MCVKNFTGGHPGSAQGYMLPLSEQFPRQESIQGGLESNKTLGVTMSLTPQPTTKTMAATTKRTSKKQETSTQRAHPVENKSLIRLRSTRTRDRNEVKEEVLGSQLISPDLLNEFSCLMQPEKPSHIVIGIDLGTTYSGIAFANPPGGIYVVQSWCREEWEGFHIPTVLSEQYLYSRIPLLSSADVAEEDTGLKRERDTLFFCRFLVNSHIKPATGRKSETRSQLQVHGRRHRYLASHYNPSGNHQPDEPYATERFEPLESEISEQLADFAPSAAIEWRPKGIKGILSLAAWKFSAGKNKSWRRCSRTKHRGSPGQISTAIARSECFGTFHQSPLWLPQAFVQSHHQDNRKWSTKLLRHGLPNLRLGKQENKNMLVLEYQSDVEDRTILLGSRNRSLESESPDQALDYHLDPLEYPAAPKAFMRFTWKEKILVRATGELDRFLQANLVLRSRWQVNSFLRNDAHADVYSLSDIEIDHSSFNRELEGHFFLAEYHGNSAVYARRRKVRMKQGGHCLDTFWYGDRQFLVMRVTRSMERFQLQNNEQEFPRLLGEKQDMGKLFQGNRKICGKLSYALVVITGQVDDETACQSLSELRSVDGFDKERKVREKRAKKRQRKRQEQNNVKTRRDSGIRFFLNCQRMGRPYAKGDTIKPRAHAKDRESLAQRAEPSRARLRGISAVPKKKESDRATT
ncbi:hypothetical protein BKA66DRAFT_438734 [Pyrenochaeta sp. MPI-SDFR-AT-0127]|nr:hypothetical protein BKA66DRAFT_438734 [Pyrenochaeta sp. MPI-SDFR-AT-0127]